MIVNSQAGFEDMPLGPTLRKALKEVGYTHPTPIQAAFIPQALESVDLIGQAQTGTGKTAAFLIPLLERLAPTGTPQAIVLGPTRELVQQVTDEALRLRGESPIRIAAVYGGQHLQRQMRELDAGTDLVIGTPGRIIDMLQRGHLRLTGIKFVVLDEADRMLDIGFRPDIERILRSVPRERQTMLLSATMPPPVLRLAQRYMREPRNINLSNDEISVDRIEQRYFAVDEDRKLELLLRLLVRERPRQCLIFCQMKSSVRRLAAELGRRIRGVMAMRGDLPQSVRNRVMQGFRDGSVRILVATDVVGRGIDVRGISHVINYDVPEDPEAYVHRIGRTGRIGRDGKAFTLVTPEQGRLLTQIEIFMNREVKRDRIEGFHGCRTRKEEPAKSTPSLEEAGMPARYRRALSL